MTSSSAPRNGLALRQALDSSDAAWIVTDTQCLTCQVNAGFERLLGWSEQALLGQRPLQLLLGEAQDSPLPTHIQQVLTSHGRFAGDLQLRHRDGHMLWVAAIINRIPEAGEVMVLTDITFSKRLHALQKQALEDVAQERPLSLLLQRLCEEIERIAPELAMGVLQVDEQGHLHPLACPSLPRDALERLNNLPIGPDMGACGQAAFLAQPATEDDLRRAPAHLQSLSQCLLQAGLQACWAAPIFSRERQVIGVLALYFREPRGPHTQHLHMAQTCIHLCTVAMEREHSRARIHQLAYYDPLTQLPNRNMFHRSATDALHAVQGRSCALLFVDLDRFKLVNDSQGHAAGDALLCEVAQRIRATARPGDVLGRLSSDEFALLLPQCSATEAEAVAQRLLGRIAEPFTIGNAVNIPHASVGICTYPEDGTDINTLLRHADQAMYVAKQHGRQRWQRFSPEINQFTQDRVAMEHALREALHNGQLQLHYQPQVLSHTLGQLHGVEALARWQHPEWGYVSPMRFIAVAEDAGMIQDFTQWLLETACHQLALWRSQGVQVPQVAVNLSTKNFHDPEFAQSVASALQRHGLAAKDLVLEITESVMLNASPATLANLESLHQLGLQLSLDDFGTGYSSLSYLHRLPISEIKLDKSFVQDLGNSVAAEALIRSVLSIAHSLHMTVVAEGVETAEQRQWLQQQDCPVLQGYLFCRPLPPQDLPGWILSHRARQSASAAPTADITH
ncbi:putative bifunctional diguanylate cyclase/phosphodiesterase [Comamonas sp. GB3 AK4-5]|uniref:putative bifunctional diguanylate cyclase/phosphodiesterase n=1 Tax=Comamonas sp. GB3 AK4-5 TaxID=3231487 RepID=UPI00351DAAC4